MKEKKIQQTGKAYWRSLDQYADTPEFKEWLHREFPQGASEMNNAWSRRNFLTLMGASMALAGLAGCRRPEEKIVPYVRRPEEIIPGKPLFYATTMPMGDSAVGVVVESHEGRPTKIEGNKLHPSSKGRSSAQMQAAILDLYDPDRSQYIQHRGSKKEWKDFVSFWQEQFKAFEENKGEGLAILSEPFSSPTLSALHREFLKKFPKASWVCWEPVSNENIINGVSIALGENYQPLYQYDKADVILSLDSDFLLTESESVTAALGFSQGRQVTNTRDSMNRLYVVEAAYSVTGAMADHRLRMPVSRVRDFVVALAKELRRQGLDGCGVVDDITPPKLPQGAAQWLTPLAKDLFRASGKSLVVAGRGQAPEVHALVVAINDALQNTGKTVSYIERSDVIRSETSQLIELANDMRDGAVTTLIMFGGNPVYTAPADLQFGRALKKVQHTIHLSAYVDETSAITEWHLPRAHFLESWGDARAVDNTVSIVQPLIQPLFGAHSDVEVLALFASGKEQSGYDIVRQQWKKILPGSFEQQWRKVLHDGLLTGSEAKKTSSSVKQKRIAAGLVKSLTPPVNLNVKEMELVLLPCTKIGDGAQGNNGWLQELPDPITKLSWDNVAMLSPATAKALAVSNEDMVKLEVAGRSLMIPVWIVPGQADFTVAVALGYGRKRAGRVGNKVGFDTYSLRVASALYIAGGLAVTKTGKTYQLANTQDHGSMEGRPIVREATLKEYHKNPKFAREMVEHPPLVSLYDDYPYDKGYQWGMVIDLNKCTGCNACTVACQSENNIPIVGKEQVRKGREMHWIRVDRYFAGDMENPEIVHQPVACQQCENAPCEQVCPVAATSHDKEGLNVMVYNRCIGTRYCSNNCPYKVRRFNFFNYTKEYPEIVKMVQNPDVTVRSRGVMEKCTYCTQRLNEAKKAAKLKGKTVRDGEVVTACQQACPADAIVFGNLRESGSKVAETKQQDRNYDLLAELNIRPRTSYLAKLRNPNPELA